MLMRCMWWCVVPVLVGCHEQMLQTGALTFDQAHVELAQSSSQIHAAQCVWKTPGDEVVLSWDATVQVAPGQGANVTAITACSGDRSPDGTELTVDGEPFDPPLPWSAFIGANFQMRACAMSQPNAYHECQAPASSCRSVAACPSGVRNPNYYFCEKACAMGAPFEGVSTYGSQGHYEIRLLSQGTTPVQTAAAATFSPSLAEISRSEQLARRMKINLERSNLDIPMFRWDYRVGTVDNTPTGNWIETFSGNLRVFSIRVFEETPFGRRYFRLSRLLVNNRPLPLADSGFCRPNPQDGTEITGDSCPELLAYTPANGLNQRDDLVDWGVEILGDPAASENRGVSETSDLFIEFGVQNVLSDALPYLAPWRGQVGGVVGVSGNFMINPPFRLRNGDSPRTWQIERMSLTGPHASEFSASVATGETLPRAMRPGGSLPINVGFQPTSVGSKTATLEVRLRDTQTNVSEVVTSTVEGDAVAPYALTVVPGSLSVQDPGLTRPFPWTIRFLIENDGPAVAVRGALTIEAGPGGGNPGPFRVLNGAGTAAPSGTQVLSGGQSETLTIAYCPTGPGTHTAQLRVSSVLWPGETIVPLQGTAPPLGGNVTQYCAP